MNEGETRLARLERELEEARALHRLNAGRSWLAIGLWAASCIVPWALWNNPILFPEWLDMIYDFVIYIVAFCWVGLMPIFFALVEQSIPRHPNEGKFGSFDRDIRFLRDEVQRERSKQ